MNSKLFLLSKNKLFLKRIFLHCIGLQLKFLPTHVKSRNAYLYLRELKKDNSFGKNITPSHRKIDILIPIIEKDLIILPHCLEGLRKNLFHPINNIYLVAPDEDRIKKFAIDNGCVFINEKDVLPLSPKDIDYCPNGENRAGWLFQQFLKMSADKISDLDFVYTIDADTVLVTPQKFESDNGKTVFLVSDEYHRPYYETYKKLLCMNSVQPFSFVSHQMLIDVKKLKMLKHNIEDVHNEIWYNAILNLIDKNEASSFSEFETMGNWMLYNYPKDFVLEYWFNLSLKRSDLQNFLNKKISTGGGVSFCFISKL